MPYLSGELDASISSEKKPQEAEELLADELTSARDTNGIPEAMKVSFWDDQSQLNQDYIVIGAGIIGLTTAVSL